MKRIILAVILSLAILPCFSQEDPKKLIDENKVWEYYRMKADISPVIELDSYSRYKFDGTEERFGRIYHKWVLLDRDTYTRNYYFDEEKEEYTFDWTFESEQFHTTIAFLREEEGKVFMLLDREEVREFDVMANPLEIWHEDAVFTREVCEGDEIILYDFTGKVGDSFIGIIEDDIITPIEISAIENVENSGENFRRYRFFPESEYYKEYQFHLRRGDYEDSRPFFQENMVHSYALEGLGILMYGTLTDFFSVRNDIYMCKCYDHTFLSNVKDLEGNYIYYDPNCSNKIPPLSSIKENKQEETNSHIYDLFGLEIREPQPGTIYIKNGKKFIAK